MGKDLQLQLRPPPVSPLSIVPDCVAGPHPAGAIIQSVSNHFLAFQTTLAQRNLCTIVVKLIQNEHYEE